MMFFFMANRYLLNPKQEATIGTEHTCGPIYGTGSDCRVLS